MTRTPSTSTPPQTDGIMPPNPQSPQEVEELEFLAIPDDSYNDLERPDPILHHTQQSYREQRAQEQRRALRAKRYPDWKSGLGLSPETCEEIIEQMLLGCKEPLDPRWTRFLERRQAERAASE